MTDTPETVDHAAAIHQIAERLIRDEFAYGSDRLTRILAHAERMEVERDASEERVEWLESWMRSAKKRCQRQLAVREPSFGDCSGHNMVLRAIGDDMDSGLQHSGRGQWEEAWLKDIDTEEPS